MKNVTWYVTAPPAGGSGCRLIMELFAPPTSPNVFAVQGWGVLKNLHVDGFMGVRAKVRYMDTGTGVGLESSPLTRLLSHPSVILLRLIVGCSSDVIYISC